MSQSDDLRKSLPIRAYLRGWLIATTAVLLVALGLATCATLYAGYQDTMRYTKIGLLNLSTAFSAQTFSLVQAIDHVMLETEHNIPEFSPGSPGKQSSDEFNAHHLAQHNLLGIYLYDSSGKLIVGEDARAPAHPPHSAIDMRKSALRITIDKIDPVTGRGVLSFARDTVDAAGKRTGQIVAKATSEQFEQAFKRVQLGSGGSVALISRDGTLLVRAPSFPTAIGTSMKKTVPIDQYLAQGPSGAFSAPSPIDGKEHLYGYQVIGDFPLVIATAVSRDDALTLWYQRVRTALLFYILISATVIYLAWRVARDTWRNVVLIGELAASEKRAEKSAEYLDTILNSLGTPIWVLDQARKIVMHNKAFSRFVGRDAADFAGQNEADTLDRTSAPERDRRYRQVLEKEKTIETTTEMRDGSGHARTVIQLSSNLHDAEGQPQVVSVLTDITERQKAEQRVAYLSNFDQLTGLPNQVHFRRLLEAEVVSAKVGEASIGVLIVALDRLQEISNLLGHEAGEAALKKIGKIFQSLLPIAKCVARIKSNEFAVLVEVGEGGSAVEQYAADLLARLSGPLPVDGRDFYLGPVIGVSIFPDDGDDADDLLRHADSARSRTDPSRDIAIGFFSERAHTDLEDRLKMEAQLRRAVERGELRLLYQPKVDIASGRIVGFESLMRWTNPELGEVSPVRFIPIAERTGLIVQIGAWALKEACRQIRSWFLAGTHVKVAVNLSPRQFHQKDLVPMIRQCLEENAIPPGCLELEITETALMSRELEMDALLHQIRALGIELSIDDFGTGYSSLAYLKRFPVQRLKVDRAFVHDLGRDADSAAIVRSVSSLGQGLKLRVLAEGVETAEQLELLRGLFCDEYQGFLFSRPVEAEAVLALCAQNQAALASKPTERGATEAGTG
jgi:diguanylate cyclase (GGDEF)-like protein/PAS domain S-box-containing protein